MLASPGEVPGDTSGWAFEFKWDGVRALIYVSPETIRIVSRNGLDMTHRFPELERLCDGVEGHALVLDGEIVATDEAGRPNFQRLQRRLHVADPKEAQRLASDFPVAFFAFDLLNIDGEDVAALPYWERRAALEALELKDSVFQTPPTEFGDPSAVLETSRSLGLEGILAKRVDAPYLPGVRSPNWIKIKHRPAQEFVVGGWTAGEGSRAGSFGSLLVGHYDDDRFVYDGRVGTGFTDQEAARILNRLAPLQRAATPFEEVPVTDDDVNWVEPRLVVHVSFAGFTDDRRLRQASYKGIRLDKDPEDVHLDTPVTSETT